MMEEEKKEQMSRKGARKSGGGVEKREKSRANPKGFDARDESSCTSSSVPFNVTPVGLFRGSEIHKHAHTHTQSDVHNELSRYLF